MLWMMFTHKGNRAAMRNRESVGHAVLGQFRTLAGRRPDDPRITALTETRPEFRTWWSEIRSRVSAPPPSASTTPKRAR
ncbi:hypothetical protein ACQP1G_10035 [Nocardia sp. CA-107356]|uniref:MmyB family transcriptional regulator n=1 Tax=Nocardia sp. CA-107356 TaxID=3239972 RepID=UPI003D8BC49A